MIIFKKLRWMNLLSTGNQFTEIYLNRSKTTLIVGENGAGKSTLLDALSFVLYGKPYRNINKPQLLNTITQKNLLVEVEFSIAKKDYLIRRGLKPNIFEIYQNDVLLNQNSDIREYQDVLEKTILKMNHKSFSQIVVLGSANYVPFMQLSAGDRRVVIEDLLDIQIFSTMNNLLKKKLDTNKSAIRDVDYQIEMVDQKVDLINKHIKSLETNNDKMIDEKNETIRQIEEKLALVERELETVTAEREILYESVADSERVSAKRAKLIEYENKIENKIRTIRKEILFFHDSETCPTCKQGIDDHFKTNEIETKNKTLEELGDALKKIEQDLIKINERLNEIHTINNSIGKIERQMNDLKSTIMVHNNSIISLQKEIKNLSNNTELVDNSVLQIQELNDSRLTATSMKQQLIEEKSILDVSSVLLKDGGIKTKIVSQYVPIINNFVNKYLAALDFFVNFELDEKFNETIKSRFRDEFSYASFSEGEKFRIDVSLMLTWRAIAKLRNSASTNLLIMDEVFDSSLDNNGTDEFLKIIDTLGVDTNVFVISHKGDALYDKFHSAIKFEKNSNFSRIAK